MSQNILEAFDLDTASKDDLEAFALANYGVDLNKRKSIENLRDEVVQLIENETPNVNPGNDNQAGSSEGEADPALASDDDNREYLINTATGVVFAATKLLKKRSDLIPCDKDGKPV